MGPAVNAAAPCGDSVDIQLDHLPPGIQVGEQAVGLALVSQLLSPLCEQSVRGPTWAWLIQRDSESSPLTRSFSQWLQGALKGTVQAAP